MRNFRSSRWHIVGLRFQLGLCLRGQRNSHLAARLCPYLRLEIKHTRTAAENKELDRFTHELSLVFHNPGMQQRLLRRGGDAGDVLHLAQVALDRFVTPARVRVDALV